MSKTTAALEAAVATVIENSPRDTPRTTRQRANIDRAFASILKLIAPRIRHFIRQYGLSGHWEDAEQCCAIAVHRAIESYDPAKAQFTTFVNWQIRGELQSLRFRLMTDQRPSAKKVEATTISLNALLAGDTEDVTGEMSIEDDQALDRTEAGASDYLAESAMGTLIDAYIDHLRQVGLEQLRRRPRAKRKPDAARAPGPRFKTATHGIDPAQLDKLEEKLARDRDIVARRVFQTTTLDGLSSDTGVTKERVRQITKTATRTIAELIATDPRFAMMADVSALSRLPRRPRRTAALPVDTRSGTPLLPDPQAPHNLLSHVEAVGTTWNTDSLGRHSAPAKPASEDVFVPASTTPAALPVASTTVH